MLIPGTIRVSGCTSAVVFCIGQSASNPFAIRVQSACNLVTLYTDCARIHGENVLWRSLLGPQRISRLLPLASLQWQRMVFFDHRRGFFCCSRRHLICCNRSDLVCCHIGDLLCGNRTACSTWSYVTPSRWRKFFYEILYVSTDEISFVATEEMSSVTTGKILGRSTWERLWSCS